MIQELHVNCGNCGHRLGKYKPGSEHETTCPKCGADLKIETRGRALKISVLRTKQERQTAE